MRCTFLYLQKKLYKVLFLSSTITLWIQTLLKSSESPRENEIYNIILALVYALRQLLKSKVLNLWWERSGLRRRVLKQMLLTSPHEQAMHDIRCGHKFLQKLLRFYFQTQKWIYIVVFAQKSTLSQRRILLEEEKRW